MLKFALDFYSPEMSKTLIIDKAVMMEEIRQLVAEGMSATITVKGNSMNPFIVDGRDRITLGPFADEELRRGCVALVRDVRGEYLVHRVIAREGDMVNPQRRSSSTQFYIVWGRTFTDEQLDAQQQRISRATQGKVTLPDHIREVYKTIGGTPHLDGQYTVFGHVVEGLDIVEKIQRTPTDSLDRPVEDVRIIKATVLE